MSVVLSHLVHGPLSQQLQDTHTPQFSLGGRGLVGGSEPCKPEDWVPVTVLGVWPWVLQGFPSLSCLRLTGTIVGTPGPLGNPESPPSQDT